MAPFFVLSVPESIFNAISAKMKNQNFQFIDLYQNRTQVKWVVIIIAVVIGGASIWYTNQLVYELKDREERLISLYASTIEATANSAFQENLMFVFQEIVVTNNSIPVILTNSSGDPIYYRNLDIDSTQGQSKIDEKLRKELAIMQTTHEPVMVTLKIDETDTAFEYQYVYYKDSDLLYRLKYYPYIQLSIISVFILLAYLAFSYSRTAEQNRIWVGLAKETAHQLGTPISSLMAWMEYIKNDPSQWTDEVSLELDKDIYKLEMITQRFSSIGSAPVLLKENIVDVIKQTVSYLRPRISSRVEITLDAESASIICPLNRALFDWVIENLSKNAVDAMSGIGIISISVKEENKKTVVIDITDNGKGIPKKKLKEVFRPGFTTKKRGWGLGLTLVKRIIETYHKGKISVKNSEENVGTTFRIVLNK